jgi:hypothetical protein
MVLLDEATSAESLRGLGAALPSRLARLLILVLARPPHPRAVAAGSEAALAAALSDHFVPQLLAGPAAAGLRVVGFESITCAAAYRLLRGLPSLEHAHLTTFMPAERQGVPAAAPAPQLQHFTPGLTSLELQVNERLDYAALEACSRLQRLYLTLQHRGTIGAANSLARSLAALTSLKELGLQLGHGYLAAQLVPGLPANVLAAGLVYMQVLAAASQLPLLEELALPGALLAVDSAELAWAQLASMLALRSLQIWLLEVLPHQPATEAGGGGAGPQAAPTALGITSLEVSGGVFRSYMQVGDLGELPPLPPGSLAVLLPELQQLDVKCSCKAVPPEYSHYDIAAALQGHKQLQVLRLDCGSPRQEAQLWGCWAPERRPPQQHALPAAAAPGRLHAAGPGRAAGGCGGLPRAAGAGGGVQQRPIQ